MDTTLFMWVSVVAISVIGTLAHFAYDASHHNKIIGIFTAVNESTWEHIKLALTPTLFWCLFDGYHFGDNPNYFCAKLISLLSLVIFIPLVFYSYTKITKKPILPIDIITFFVAIILSQFIFYYILNLDPMWYVFTFYSCIGLFIFFGAYMTLTLAPLKETIFKDPITGKYGFAGHGHLLKNSKSKSSKK